MHRRSLYKTLWDQLSADKAMIMLAGPRQSGKTTFAREIVAQDYRDVTYFNWDLPADKRRLLKDPGFFSYEPRSSLSSRPLVILDEIHKYRDWKNYLKGVCDQFAGDYQFLVTGSGRLEYSRKTGDSLAGRFLRFHLFPFTLTELTSPPLTIQEFLEAPLEQGSDDDPGETLQAFNLLWDLSGFPEPFLKGKKSFWARWSTAFGEQIVRDDIRTVADIRNLDTMELLFALLPSRVASTLSINNLAGDLQVSFDTVKNWLHLFDAFYLTFRIPPWTPRISRSILKEKKLYLFNYPVIENDAARLENLVALELLRAVETWTDRGWGTYTLHYLRNKEKQEVDFLVALNNHPLLLIEVKLEDEAPAPHLLSFQKVLGIPAVQLVRKEGIRKIYRNQDQHILVITAHRWLARLP